MLGRGDRPTFDARRINLELPDMSKQEVSNIFRRGGGAGGDQAVDKLAERQKQLALALDPSLEAFRQHLTHHTIWDLIGGTETLHDDIARAMLNR
jgi:hypothetical protein